MFSRATRDGFLAGLVAGLAMLAAMYLASGIVGNHPLPGLLQQPLLQAMPGPVFGFLIDNLKHAGKVVEEFGLIVAMLVGLGALGALYGRLSERGLPHLGLLVGALGWAVVSVILLPLSGDGFFGLDEGLTTPLVWGLLFVIYATVLEIAFRRRQPPEPADPGRRRAIAVIPLGIAAASLGVLGLRLIPGWAQAIAAPPESGLSGVSPDITPVENFYVVSKNFADPVVSSKGWTLNVHGLVDNPLKLSYQDLVGLPPTTEIVTLECISNVVGGEQISTGSFTGASLRDIITMAQPRSGARSLNFRARDGYTETVPLSQVMASPEILLAYQLGGHQLPDLHGFPARILIPGHYGMKGPKWLDDVEVAASAAGGYWEGQGWNPDAAVRTTSRFDRPHQGDVLRLGAIQLAGIAFAGKRGISAVDWSSDGGRTWHPADLKPPASPLSWTLWTASWTPTDESAYVLLVRATDGSGQAQTSEVTSSYPNGSGGFHKVQVSVAR
jgi:DMSO/TMAO reductase YedYZ molybdopterin-dependent catalytic subunit